MEYSSKPENHGALQKTMYKETLGNRITEPENYSAIMQCN